MPRTEALLPTSVSVLSAEEIDAQLAHSLNEVLRSISGLHLQQSGARGGNAAVYLRGLDPNHVLVLVDGVRLNDPTNPYGGAFDPTTLSVLDIERIEIVRGPLSAVYGVGALAGAINVITRRTQPDEEPRFSLDGGGGRFDSGHVRGRASAGVGLAGLSLAGGYTTNGDPYSDGGYRGGNLKATVDTMLPGDIDVRANMRFSDAESEAFPQFSGGPLYAVIRELEDRDTLQASMGLRASHQATEWLELALRLEYAHSQEDLSSPGVAPTFPMGLNAVPPIESRSRFDRTRLTFLGSATPVDGLRITTGGDFQWEDGQSDTLYDFGVPVPASFALDRTIGGWFLEGIYHFDWGLALSASVRGDFPDEADSEWSPSAGATFAIPRTPLTLYGNYSEGFKLPSFYALGNALVGNPELKSERSQGWEFGLRATFFGERVRMRLGYFDIEVRDLIDFDPTRFQLVNRSHAVSRGAELEIDVPFSNWLRFGGSTTFNPTDLVNDDADLRNRPRWQGDLYLYGQPLKGVQLGLRAIFVGSVKSASNPTGLQAVTLESWERLDFTGSWKLRDWLKLYLAIENLTNTDYQEAVGFPAVGIYPRAGVELSF